MPQRRFFRTRTVAPNPLYRHAPKRTRAWAWVLIPVLLLVGFAILAATPRYTVRTITVTASPSISGPRVQGFVADRISGRILGIPRASQFLISPRTLASQIRSALGTTVTLKTLTVERRWPDGLFITLQETGGAYTLTSEVGSLLLDSNGTAVSRVQGIPGALFAIADPMNLPWQLGENVIPGNRLAALHGFLEDLRGQGITVNGARMPIVTCYPEISTTDVNANATDSVNANTDTCDLKALARLNPDITLLTAEGWELEVSLVNDRVRQLADLSTLLTQKFPNGRSTLHSVDVRIAGRAYYR